MKEAIARRLQGANAIRMLSNQPWESICDAEREHWLFLAEAALAAQQDGVREVLEWIAAKPDEDNEWDGRDKFHECRDRARDALARLEQAGNGEGA